MDDFTKTRVCEQCGKTFYIGVHQRWAYVRVLNSGYKKWFCCYSCMRQYDLEMDLIKKAKKKAKRSC